MAAPPYKRRQYLVDRPYQLRFVTRVFLIVMAVAVAASLISSVLLCKGLYATETGSQTLLVSTLLAVAVTLLIELLLAVPLVFILGIRQSHRVVGPMNRLKQTLKAISEGDFTRRITLREGDALEDLAKAINEMAALLQQRFPRSPSS